MSGRTKIYKKKELFGDLNNLIIEEQCFYTIPSQLKANLEDVGDKDVACQQEDEASLFTYFPFVKIFEIDDGLSISDFSEEPQSFSEWKYFMSKMKISSWSQFQRSRQKHISILPVGPFPLQMECFGTNEYQQSLFEVLREFGQAFLPGINFEILQAINYSDIEKLQTRTHPITGQFQILMSDVMQYLIDRRPKTSFAIVAVSWFDFYPCNDMNNILGEGNAFDGCAAISFGHYGKQNCGSETVKGRLTDGYQHPQHLHSETTQPAYLNQLSCDLLLQVVKAFCHELCHTIGLSHCQFFSCCMNATPTIAAVKQQPLTMCPICLRKLQYKLGFSIVPRYHGIIDAVSTLIQWQQNFDSTSVQLTQDKRYGNCIHCQNNDCPLSSVLARLRTLIYTDTGISKR